MLLPSGIQGQLQARHIHTDKKDYISLFTAGVTVTLNKEQAQQFVQFLASEGYLQ